MRYLKHFESISNEYMDNLKLFCDENLIRLIDNGFTFVLEECNNYIDIEITSKNTFKWSDVKDVLIPFITVLKDEYYLSSAVVFGLYTSDPGKSKKLLVNHNKIINDDIDNIKHDEYLNHTFDYALSEYNIYYIIIITRSL